MLPGDFTSALSGRVRPILAALHTVPIPVRSAVPVPGQSIAIRPFVTISREAGAGGLTLAEKLLQRLGARGPAEPPWAVWDRQVIEKVAQDLHISTRLVESLEQSSRTWLDRLLGGLSSHDVDDIAVFHRAAQTLHAIAQAGHAIIVGRGGVFITQQLPRGVHVRLVAPLESRITRMMDERNWSRPQASQFVRQTESQREAFYRKFFPKHPITPEIFTITLNTGDITDDQMADCVASLVA